MCAAARKYLIVVLCILAFSARAEEKLTLQLPAEHCPEYEPVIKSYLSNALVGMFGGNCEEVKEKLIDITERMLHFAEDSSCYGPQWDHVKAIEHFKSVVKDAHERYDHCLEENKFMDGLKQENDRADKAERETKLRNSPKNCIGSISSELTSADFKASEETRKILDTCTAFDEKPASKVRACTDFIAAIRVCGPGARAVSDQFYYAMKSRALAYIDLKDYAVSTMDLDDLLAQFPEDPYYYELRSGVYSSMNDVDRAIEDYDAVVRLRHWGSSFVYRAKLYLSKGDFDRAMADYAEAIAIGGPKDVPLYLVERGEAFRSKGKLDQAIEDYDEAIRLEPNEAAAYNSRGLAEKAKGDTSTGEADILKSQEMSQTFDACMGLSSALYNDFKDVKVPDLIKRCNADGTNNKSICNSERESALKSAQTFNAHVPSEWNCQ